MVIHSKDNLCPKVCVEQLWNKWFRYVLNVRDWKSTWHYLVTNSTLSLSKCVISATKSPNQALSHGQQDSFNPFIKQPTSKSSSAIQEENGTFHLFHCTTPREVTGIMFYHFSFLSWTNTSAYSTEECIQAYRWWKHQILLKILFFQLC